MSTNALNVTAGKPMIGGAVHVAPLNTPLPTTASEELDAAFEDVGYISADGVKNDMSRSSASIRAWGGDEVLNIQNEKNDNFKYTMIEAKNPVVLKQVYGAENVEADENGISIKVNSKELTPHAWVFDMLLSDGSIQRDVIPNGKITNVDEVTYSDTAAVGYGTTLNCAPDEDGNTHYKYIEFAEESDNIDADSEEDPENP